MTEVPEPAGLSSDASQTRRGHLGFDDPFATAAEDRRADRRFRGRLVAPVTVWTAGTTERRAGLTVSSLLVAEGDPAEVIGLLDPLADLFGLVVERGSFAVHVLASNDRRVAGLFAGAYPVDPFEDLETYPSDYGPLLFGPRHILGCLLVRTEEVGFQNLVRGRVESIRIAEDAGEPLVRYRGRYRRLVAEP